MNPIDDVSGVRLPDAEGLSNEQSRKEILQAVFPLPDVGRLSDEQIAERLRSIGAWLPVGTSKVVAEVAAMIAEARANAQQIETHAWSALIQERDAWRHVAAYYLGDFTDTATPEEARREAIRRATSSAESAHFARVVKQASEAAYRRGQERMRERCAAEFRILVCAPDELPEQHHALVEEWCITQLAKIEKVVKALETEQREEP